MVKVPTDSMLYNAQFQVSAEMNSVDTKPPPIWRYETEFGKGFLDDPGKGVCR